MFMNITNCKAHSNFSHNNTKQDSMAQTMTDSTETAYNKIDLEDG